MASETANRHAGSRNITRRLPSGPLRAAATFPCGIRTSRFISRAMLIDAAELHRICMPDTTRCSALLYFSTMAPASRFTRVPAQERREMTRTKRPELLHRERLTTQVLRNGLDFREIDHLREITRP